MRTKVGETDTLTYSVFSLSISAALILVECSCNGFISADIGVTQAFRTIFNWLIHINACKGLQKMRKEKVLNRGGG